MDAVVRFPRDEGSESTPDTIYRVPSNARPTNAWRGLGLDGGHKAGHQLR